MANKNVTESQPKNAQGTGLDIVKGFCALPFDEKVKVFKEINGNMSSSFDIEFKKQDERSCFLKEHYEVLIRRGK